MRGTRGQQRSRNNWQWGNMYSVAEEEEEEDAALRDFGLQLDAHQQEQQLNHGGYHAPLLENDHHHNPLSLSQQFQLHGSEYSSSNNNHGDLNGDSNDNEGSGNDGFGAFVLLKRLKLLPKNDGYAYVSDLDAFFSSLYNYYYMRGLGSIIGKHVVELVSLFFTLWLSLILFAYVDWTALSGCNDEHTCHESFAEAYIIQRPFSSGGSFLRKAWILIYTLLFSTYGVVCVLQFGHGIIASLESKTFLEEVLGVSDRDLEVGRYEWGEIVERMSEAQRVGRCRVAILPGRRSGVDGIGSASMMSSSTNRGGDNEEPTGHLVVAQRIMRRENFMIAFFNRGLLDLTLPTLPPQFGRVATWMNKPKEEKRIFFSKSIEWSIYFCVLNYMFNHSRKIRPAFYGDPSSLRRRFFLCGVAHAIFMPFLLFFVSLHFFMSNIYDWRSTKEYLGPREWSAIAKWKFRELNELNHLFERRMEPSYKSASAYLEMFSKPSPLAVAVGRILVFVSGSLGTLLLVFAAINDAILLHVKVGNWNLLWYAGVLGASFSIGKALLPKSNNPYYCRSRRNMMNDMSVELEKVASHTHFLPDSWRGKGWDDKTKKDFSAMFQYKANHFAMEVASIVVAPIVLCVSLPRCADEICKFVRESKVEVGGVGDVVGFSTFDFDSFEDENWSDKDDRSDGIAVNTRLKTRHGKMEKSFFNFKTVYPSWKMPASGKNLVSRLDSFREKQDIALARERRLHIEAAAAQLETLRRLEVEKENKAATIGLAGFVDDNHIRTVSSGPDSGGGSARMDVSQQTNESFGSFPHEDHDDLQQHIPFEESAHSFVPPHHAFAHSSVMNNSESVRSSSMRGASPGGNNFAALGSVMHYGDTGLSTHLRGVLNGSSLIDPYASQLSQSFTGSLVPIESTDEQYLWLDRYHAESTNTTINRGAGSNDEGEMT
ncbi:autophagy-related protein 9 [Skeletonema marinoi]|uniref:Autophagy-related protein 9 n=1 Tax=Skeletonema marinoi TaxID=267567 RepID=A0AAD8XZG1_9STRA|nr:autophagy-related protein 9 [Skeletonema marinoi]